MTTAYPATVVPQAAFETWDAVVVGGGVAGLSAAWQLTRIGLRPLLVEARGYTGGLVAGGEVGGVRTDLGAEGFVMRGHAVTDMVDSLGLEVVGPGGGGANLFLPPAAPTLDGETGPAKGWRLHPFIKDSYLGIPSRPLATDVVSTIGQEGARRAAKDAILPSTVGTGAQDPADLASLVRSRMGEAVLDLLVRPVVAGIHTSDPCVLDADTVAPGLREATARLGSLQAAVGEFLERRRERGRGGKAVDVTTHGGLFALTDALREAVLTAGGRVEVRTGAQGLRCLSESTPLWELTLTPTGPGPTPSAEPVALGAPRQVRSPRVVLACSAGAALRLLGAVDGVDTSLTVPVGSPIARLTLVARSQELSGNPVGSGLLVAPVPPGGAPAPVRAKALSHLSLKWPWTGQALRERHGEHVHALRLSYGRPGEPRPEVSLPEVLDDVAVLTGVRIPPEDVIDHRLVRWDGTLPPVTPEHRERAQHLEREVSAHPGLGVTGAWVAGSGIASVVAHAREQASRLALGSSVADAGTTLPRSPKENA